MLRYVASLLGTYNFIMTGWMLRAAWDAREKEGKATAVILILLQFIYATGTWYYIMKAN